MNLALIDQDWPLVKRSLELGLFTSDFLHVAVGLLLYIGWLGVLGGGRPVAGWLGVLALLMVNEAVDLLGGRATSTLAESWHDGWLTMAGPSLLLAALWRAGRLVRR